mgnify:CR=1 FL=1|tara:strand:+ start:766 stop:966 length:201 start_codon:yes stop_codon:yes gene_type:complete
MSNNTKAAALFDELTFTDVFETFDEEYLTLIAEKNPDQLKRMCIFLSLDDQIRKEKFEKLSLKEMN